MAGIVSLPLRLASVTADALDQSAHALFELDGDALAAADRALVDAGLNAMLVATCHRVELLWWGRGNGAAWLRRWAAARGIALPRGAVRVVRAERAVHRLLATTAGLTSPLRGESEIQGQMRRAAERARSGGAMHGPLARTIERVLAASRRVRHAFGDATPSLGSGVLELATRLRAARGAPPRVVVIGTGSAATSVLRALAAAGLAAHTTVTGRTPARVHALAGRHAMHAAPWASLGTTVADADVVVSAIRGTLPADALQPANGRQATPRLWIDVAMPASVPRAPLGDLRRSLEDLRGHGLGDRDRAARRALRREYEKVAALITRDAMAHDLARLARAGERIAREEAAATAAATAAPGAVPDARTADHGENAVPAEVLQRYGERVARRVLHEALRVVSGDAPTTPRRPVRRRPVPAPPPPAP